MGSDHSPPPRSRRRDDSDNEFRDSRRSSHRDERHRDSRRTEYRGRNRSSERGIRHRRSRSPREPRRRSYSRGRGDDERPSHDRRRRSRDGHKEVDKPSRHRYRARDEDEDDEDDRGHKKGSHRRGGDGDNKQVVRRNGPLPSQADSFALTTGEEPPKPKEKANYGNSGALAAASNSVTQADGSTIVLKYHEPAEARKASPKDQWKLFVFKGEDIVDTVPLNNRSCWLVGRDMAVVDMGAEHPSISKQHAVIQFRYIEKKNEYGDKIGKVKPYLIDLESANGTMLNSKKVPDSRYLELRDKDMIQFGQSTREYVLMLAPKD